MNDEPLTCRYGHELTGSNFVPHPNGRWMECRTCRFFDDVFTELEQRHTPPSMKANRKPGTA